MVDYVDVAIDLVTFSLALGVSFFAFLIRNGFKGGIVEKPWRVIGPAPLAYAAGQLVHVAQDLYGESPLLEAGHLIFEGLFLLMLLYGFYLIYLIWKPGAR